jgi:hypothetical protein
MPEPFGSALGSLYTRKKRYPNSYNPARTAGWQHRPWPCDTCRSLDDRDAAHAAGCPALPRASKEALLRLALAVESYWAAKFPKAKLAHA